MNRDEQSQILLAVVVIYVLYEMNREPTFTEDFQEGVRRTRARVQRATDLLERSGAAIYDATHDDAGHRRDLPGNQLSREQVLALATRAGFPKPKEAAAIALAESGGTPHAVLRTPREYSVGLWQINTLVHPYSVEDMKDPRKNASAAFKISKGGTDWAPWATYASGAYRRYMTGVLA